MLQILTAKDTVLDLGCDPSSPVASLEVRLNVGVDVEPLSRQVNNTRPLVQADAEGLPFRDDSFTFVVANHSMEHIPDLDACLRELKRVMHPEGTLYTAVPLSVTLSDRLYRFIYSGGGHVQPFRSVDEVTRRISSIVGMPCIGYSRIQSGFHFLTSPDVKRLGRRKRWLIGSIPRSPRLVSSACQSSIVCFEPSRSSMGTRSTSAPVINSQNPMRPVTHVVAVEATKHAGRIEVGFHLDRAP